MIYNHVAWAGELSQESGVTNRTVMNKQLQLIKAIAGPFYAIIKVMMKGPNKQSNNNQFKSPLFDCVSSLYKFVLFEW